MHTNSHSQGGMGDRGHNAKPKAAGAPEASSAGRGTSGGQGDSPGVARGGGVAAAPVTAAAEKRCGAGGAATQGTGHGAGKGSGPGADDDDGFLQLHLGSGKGPRVAEGQLKDDVDLTIDGEDGAAAAAEEAGEQGAREAKEVDDVSEVERRCPETGGEAGEGTGRAGAADQGAAAAGQPGVRAGPSSAGAAVAAGGGGGGRQGGGSGDIAAERTSGAAAAEVAADVSGARKEGAGRAGHHRKARLGLPGKGDGDSLTGRHDPHHKRQQQPHPHQQQQQQHSASESDSDSDVVVVSPGGEEQGGKEKQGAVGSGRGTSAQRGLSEAAARPSGGGTASRTPVAVQHGNGGEDDGEEGSDNDDFMPPTQSTGRRSRWDSTPYHRRTVSSGDEEEDKGHDEEKAGRARGAGGQARSSRKQGRQSGAHPVDEEGVGVQGAGERRPDAQEGGGVRQVFKRRREGGPNTDARGGPPDPRHGSGTGAAGEARAGKRAQRDDADRHQPRGTPGEGEHQAQRSSAEVVVAATIEGGAARPW